MDAVCFCGKKLGRDEIAFFKASSSFIYLFLLKYPAAAVVFAFRLGMSTQPPPQKGWINLAAPSPLPLLTRRATLVTLVGGKVCEHTCVAALQDARADLP